MTTAERIEELIALKSIGLLEGEELKEFETLLKTGSGDIETRLREFERASSSLLYSIDEIKPPKELGEKLFNQISSLEKPAQIFNQRISFWNRLQPLWYGFGTAFAAIAIFLFFANQSLNNQILNLNQKLITFQEKTEEQSGQIASLESRLLSKDDMIAELEQTISKKADLVGYLENPNVIVIDLGNLKPDLNSVGRVMWDKSADSAIFCGINLPQITPDKIYQLWAIIDSTPKSYGIFSVDEKGNGIIKLNYEDPYESIQQFAVTLEPAGGVPQPTGEMYLAGSSKL
ncbi:MAG: anti-sigma factor [Thermodesulfobacteriota bacterium]